MERAVGAATRLANSLKTYRPTSSRYCIKQLSKAMQAHNALRSMLTSHKYVALKERMSHIPDTIFIDINSREIDRLMSQYKAFAERDARAVQALLSLNKAIYVLETACKKLQEMDMHQQAPLYNQLKQCYTKRCHN